MASFLSTSPMPTTSPCIPKLSTPTRIVVARGLRLKPNSQFARATRRSLPLPNRFKTTISCSAAQQETLQTVQSIIAKQLSIDESAVIPETKFAELGADSLDTVEIMMALEEKFEVSIGEGGAENIATVQDAADLIEKVKAASA